MNAPIILTQAAAPGWTLDANSHTNFATLAHVDGAVIELCREGEGHPWVCDVGHPGRMVRRQNPRGIKALAMALEAVVNRGLPEVLPVHRAAWAAFRAENLAMWERTIAGLSEAAYITRDP